MASSAKIVRVNAPDGTVRDIRVSSPDRIMWQDAGITKWDLATYVASVDDGLMRAVGDRPVTLQRFPDGVEGEEFFSKNPPKGVPEWARSVMCTYPSARKHPQLVIDEIATAVWAVQMNTVTFHPWPVRRDDNDNPDEMRIDLDPQPGRVFADAVVAAYGLKVLLEELGYIPWVKTSGNRGVHVYVRIARTHEFLDVRHGVIGIGRELERRMPELVTMAWWKEERGEKVFVDFNQANRPRPDDRVGLQPAATARSAGVDAGPVGSTPRGEAGRLHRAHGAGDARRRRGCLGWDRCRRGQCVGGNCLVGQGHRGTRSGGDALPSRLSENARRTVKSAAEPSPQALGTGVAALQPVAGHRPSTAGERRRGHRR